MESKKSHFLNDFNNTGKLNILLSAFDASVYLYTVQDNEINCLKDDLGLENKPIKSIRKHFEFLSKYTHNGSFSSRSRTDADNKVVEIDGKYFFKMVIEVDYENKPSLVSYIIMFTPALLRNSGPSLNHLIRDQKKEEFEEIFSLLSEREIEIMKGIGQGMEIKEIALQLGISHHTVSTHRKRLFAKFRINKSVHLAVWAEKLGLL